VKLESEGEKKLKMLSVVQMASQKVLSFEDIGKATDLTSKSDILDLCLECIYSKLVSATIDHQNSLLCVSKTMGRDVRPEEIPSMLDKLENWVTQISNVEHKYQTDIDDLNANVKESQLKKETDSKMS